MLVGMITQIFWGCITGLVNQFWLHIVFRCFSAMSCALMYTAGLMICMLIFILFIFMLNIEWNSPELEP